MTDWQVGQISGLDDAALAAAVTERFQAIFRNDFADVPFLNDALGIEVRATRRMDEGWRVFLLLTPWMLSRLFLPERDPGLPVPDAWRAEARARTPYVVIGPRISLPLLGGLQQAHINYDATLGHYVVQPLVQSMSGYRSADAVFAAWNDVIAARARVMDEQQRECPWQRELSRREFFGRLVRPRG
ncbi:MAG: [NiFe]-hydrogenase assembly chaperone HybE [Gammaproteobacteria bacterium]